jgi:membrane-associated protein
MPEFVLLDFHWTQLLQPQFYIENGGLWLLLFVVFAETGLFAGFFLPGDSLLFVAGIYALSTVEQAADGTQVLRNGLSDEFFKLFGYQNTNEWLGLIVLIVLIALAGILGNWLGYWFGKRVGPSIYHWKDTMFFKKRYLEQAHDFYEKHGAIAIVGARFLPLVRTFAPIVAGIVSMDRKKFAFYNIVGSFAWVSSMILAGHFLQKWILAQFGFDLKSHLEIIVLGIVAVTTAPVLYQVFFGKKKKAEA